MKAMLLSQLGTLDETSQPLRLAEVPVPRPSPGEVLVQVLACGVCHTELDEIEGRTAPRQLPMILGHQVVGRIVEITPGVAQRQSGERVGIGWIYRSSGQPDENLAAEFLGTGRDVHGGYAQYMVVPEDYCYPIPEDFSDVQAAPLLCAGAVGFRALRLTQLRDGQRLGLTGFGGSAHLVLQTARFLFPSSPVYVFARDAEAREFALQLGAVWAGDTTDHPPAKLNAIIDTTPVWKPVLEALAALAPGGRLVINAIRKQAGDQRELLRLSYHEHLWMERQIQTVANVTQFDIREFLPIAAAAMIRPTVEIYSLQDANRALRDLKFKPVRGAKVLSIGA